MACKSPLNKQLSWLYGTTLSLFCGGLVLAVQPLCYVSVPVQGKSAFDQLVNLFGIDHIALFSDEQQIVPFCNLIFLV